MDAKGRTYVADRDGVNGPRVVVFAPDGTVLEQWGLWGPGTPELREPNGIAVDGRGYVYVVGYEHPRPIRLGPVRE